MLFKYLKNSKIYETAIKFLKILFFVYFLPDFASISNFAVDFINSLKFKL